MALAAALCAAPYVIGGAVWDDAPLIQAHLSQLSVGELGSLWTAPVRDEGPGSTYFRPVALTAMAILGRVGIPAIHLATLLLHALSSWLLVRVLASVGKGGAGPWMGGLIFAVHPLAGEVLGWASAFPDALAVSLGLMAVYLRGGWRMPILLLLAALSKETALLIPLAFGLCGVLHKGWWRWWGATFVVLCLARLGAGVESPGLHMDKLGLIPLSVGWSIGSIAWPFPLSAVRDVLAPPVVVPWLGLVLGMAMIALARRNKRMWVGLGLVVVAPVLALPTVLDGYLLGERYMYAGLVGFALWVALTIRRSLPGWTGVAVAAAALSVHMLRAPDWREDTALFSAAVQAHPRSSYAWHFLGVSHQAEGRWREAAECFGSAIASGHPHPLDRLLQIQSLVESGEAKRALGLAEAGPRNELTAAHVAWWGRAAWEAGDEARASEILLQLRTPKGFDGPLWVSEIMEQIQRVHNPP